MIEAALVAWFPITAILFVLMPPHKAAACSLIFGVALLPANRAIPLPVLPDLTQYSVPVVASMIMIAVKYPQRLIAVKPGTSGDFLILLMIFGALITNLTNGDVLVYGPKIKPALTASDTVNDGLRLSFRWLLPFLIGRTVVRTAKEAVDVLMILALCGLAYVPFILVEFQTGPIWHALIYGSQSSPSTFWHSIRYGGFRPSVLMNHGLTLSVFMFHTVIAWVYLARARIRPLPVSSAPIAFFMLGVCAWFKTRSILVYALASLPMILVLRPRMQLRIAGMIAIVLVSYPFLRSIDMIPVQTVAEIAEEYAGADAAQSFMQRIETEDEIIAHVDQRWWFGWGGYARYFRYDPLTGVPLSVMDGFWVMEFGQGGVVRYALTFSFLIFPILFAWFHARRIESTFALRVICAMVWICVIRTWNLLPNSAVDPWHVFIGGAACSVVARESRRRPVLNKEKAAPAPPPTRSSDAEPHESPPAAEPEQRPDSIAAGLLNR